MSEIVCKKCERALGYEILKCPRHRQSSCPFRVKKIRRAADRANAWSLILIGFGIFFFTLSFAKPRDYAASIFVMIEIATITLLFLLAAISFCIGFFTLQSKRTIVFDPFNKNTWEQHAFGSFELYSTIVSNWKEFDCPDNITKVPINFSDILVNTNQKLGIHFLTAVIINLFTQGYLKIFSAQHYSISGQTLNSVNDSRKLYLLVDKELLSGAGDAEKALHKTITKLSKNSKDYLPVELGQVLKGYFVLINNQTHNLLLESKNGSLDQKYDNFQSNLEKVPEQFLSFIDQEIISALNIINANDISKAKFWKRFLDFKQLRVAIIFIAIVGFFIIRFYLPVYRVEQIAGKIDNAKVAASVKGAVNTIKSTSNDVIDSLNPAKLEEYQRKITRMLRSKSKEVQIAGIEMLNQLKQHANFAQEDLTAMLKNKNAEVRAKAIKALADSSLNPKETIETIKHFKNDPDPYVRQSAVKAIKKLQQTTLYTLNNS